MKNLYLLSVVNKELEVESVSYMLNTDSIFYVINLFLVISSVATIFWMLSKNKYISILIVPPTFYIISITESFSQLNPVYILLAMLIQAIVIWIIEKFQKKYK